METSLEDGQFRDRIFLTLQCILFDFRIFGEVTHVCINRKAAEVNAEENKINLCILNSVCRQSLNLKGSHCSFAEDGKVMH